MGRTPKPPASEYTCTLCKTTKPLTEFNKKPGGWMGTDGIRRTSKCKECVIAERRLYPYNTRPRKTDDRGGYIKEYKPRQMLTNERIAYRMLLGARRRAKQGGYPCTITLEDIVIPDTCLITGMKLKVNENTAGPDSPSLDKIIPSLGYVPGNIMVISHAANLFKYNHSLEDLRKYCFNTIRWIDSLNQQAPR